jgi:hypothetical protein
MDDIEENIAKKKSRAQALLQNKKRAGHKPCSKNCVDPISPKNWI